ncbi:hypothetical protein OSB04_030187 [Centaurea solstitialis]|uniref:Late embryogenesis abundant protein LEA-2 subgroup domain-containing protein n=1 Tax=Centaurea solstitialis TaxID=347529 RepID=A0AA38W4Q4_9ASTR|nr:hypothetical protein OSB04_030187 [Centaurea solstitialis]
MAVSLPLLSNSAQDERTSFTDRYMPCFVVAFLLGGLVIVGLVVLITPAPRYCLDPQFCKEPRIDLQEVGVEYLNYSVNGPTTASISLAIRMLFKAKNHDYMGLEYGVSSFNITYRGVPLGWATLPGFYLYYHDWERVQMTATVDRVNLDNAADFIRDASVHDLVELWITGDVNVNMTTEKSAWRGPKKYTTTTVSIDCVIAISPRKQALISKLCGPWI